MHPPRSITFSPPLPAWKTSAIRRLGFGVTNRVLLVFPHVFWEDSTYIGTLSTTRGEFHRFLNLYKYTNQPALLAFVSGDAAILLETQSDQEIASRAMQILTSVL
jgi:monoamine oxidase